MMCATLYATLLIFYELTRDPWMPKCTPLPFAEAGIATGAAAIVILPFYSIAAVI